MKQLTEEGGFAIRSIQYDEAGKEFMRTEVTSISKRKAAPRGAGGSGGEGGQQPDMQEIMKQLGEAMKKTGTIAKRSIVPRVRTERRATCVRS